MTAALAEAIWQGALGRVKQGGGFWLPLTNSQFKRFGRVHEQSKAGPNEPFTALCPPALQCSANENAAAANWLGNMMTVFGINCEAPYSGVNCDRHDAACVIAYRCSTAIGPPRVSR